MNWDSYGDCITEVTYNGLLDRSVVSRKIVHWPSDGNSQQTGLVLPNCSSSACI
jgi:hypothetical protein